jgi:hypothetical protein
MPVHGKLATMRALTWVVLVALATGCVLSPRGAEPSPDAPLTENPETLAPRTRPHAPAPTSPATGGPSEPPAPSTPPTGEPPPDDAPAPPASETPPPTQDAPPTFVVWPRRDRDDPPPRDVGFAAGLDEPDGTFLLSWEEADDGLGFHAALASSADTRIRIDSLARLVSRAPDARGIVLSTEPIDDPSVTEATLALWDEDGAPILALDLLSPAPSASAMLPAGAVYDLSWTLALAEGATQSVPVTVRLGVAS